MDGPGPYSILDFGCGPGCDLMHFTSLGHEAVGLDGSAELAALARKHPAARCCIKTFSPSTYPRARLMVCSRMRRLHVPRQELPRVLQELWQTLKPGGILFSSNPRGDNQEGFNGTRFGSFHSLEAWRGYISAAGFEELTHYYRPEGRPRDEQPWLAVVAKKVSQDESSS